MIQKWIVSGDYQIPFHDERSLSAFEKFMAAHTWDGYLNLGDFVDMDSISSFNKGKPGNIEGRYLADDFKIANKVLDRHQQIIWSNNPYAKFVLLEGNHEERVDRFLAENPTFKDLFSIEIQLKLKERKFEWVRSWSKGETFKLGKATFTHGDKIGQYHAKQMVTEYGGSIFYGHVHDMMCIPISYKGEADKIHVGQSMGCLCKYDLPYMRGKAHKWQQGFGIFYILPDGSFTYYTPRIINNSFVGPDGKYYAP